MFSRLLLSVGLAPALLVSCSRLPSPNQQEVKNEATAPPAAKAEAPKADEPQQAKAKPETAEAAAAMPQESGIYQSVLRIENSAQSFDYRTPWNAGRFGGGNGTGFVVGENRILTNAHVVSNARRLLLRKHGDAGVYPARLVHVAHDCDLALLELEDPAPLQGVAKLEIDDVPALESAVRVIGYPIGGELLSVTRGVVSRIDFNTYSHSGVDQHLVVQIDAAINPGNSGGPVLQGDKVVGVAFQGLRTADNTGYMIPTPVIKRFLKDVEDGHYDHYVDLSFSEFDLINPAQRAALGLKDDNRGVLVTQVSPLGSSDGKLQVGDILLGLDDYPVLANGQVRIEGRLVNMHEVVERKFNGDKVKLHFLRGGTEMESEVTLSRFMPATIFATEYEQRPVYAVFGGLVFQPLSRNMLAAYGSDTLEIRHLLDRYTQDALYKEWKQIVLLTQVLPDEINADLSGLGGLIVEKVNGQAVRSMDDLKKLLLDPLDQGALPEFIVIECLGADRPLILEGKRVAEARQRIGAKYGIQNDSFLGTSSGW